MFTNFNQMIAELGEAKVMDVVNKYRANMEYRKDYGKARRVEAAAIVKAYKSGELSYGGTRVEMKKGEE